MVWTSLNNCKTKVIGSLSGKTANLTETDVLSGDDVAVPNKYTGDLSDDGSNLKGTYADYEGAPGTFHLTFQSVSAPPAAAAAAAPVPMDISSSDTIAIPTTELTNAFAKLQTGTTWNIKLIRPTYMELDIETTADNTFTGKVSIEENKTDIKGSWTATDFKMEDSVYTYDGKFDGTKKIAINRTDKSLSPPSTTTFTFNKV